MKNWIILIILGAAGYYIYKKGQTATAAAPGAAQAGFLSTMKSGLYSAGSSLLPGIVPSYSAPAGSTPPSYTPTATTGSSGGGGSVDTGGNPGVITTEAAYYTRDLTRLTPFVNL